jgi:cell division protein FtsB
MSQKELTQRLTLIMAILILTLIVGIFAMRCYINDLTATIAAQGAEIQALEEKNAELQVIVDEVEKAETAIRAVNPDALADEIHALAVRQVGKSRKYDIPRELITYRDWVEADLRWLNATRRGPCGEVSTAQVWKPTFRVLRPQGDYYNVDEVYDAGCQYLADCYKTAKRWMPKASNRDLIRLTLAFYNAGMSHKPDEALYKARVHVRRVERIFAIAEKLGVV